MNHDYIIVGSGAGGSVLASRLSADPGIRVLVLEAGSSDSTPVHKVPKGFAFTMTNPAFTRQYATEPAVEGGIGDTWFRGRVVGGSTTVNGLVWNRGWKDDFNGLQEAGNAGWGWQTFLNAYRELENFRPKIALAPGLHGQGGPVDVEIARPRETICEAFISSAGATGMQRVDDVNGSDLDRVGYAQFSTRRGLRVSAASAHLRPALRRPNLTLATGSVVERVLFDGKRAIGVCVTERGRPREYYAEREVLLCGGALETPQLLERSGIGRADVLKSAGVEQVIESPNVGERLSEHRGLRFMYQVTGAKGFNHLVNDQFSQLVTGAKFLVTRSGMIAQGSASVLAYFAARPDAERPDAIAFFSPMSTKTATLHDKKLATADQPGMMAAVYPLRPTSQGSIHIRSAVAESAPSIRANFLDSEYDKSLTVHMAAVMREVFATGSLQRLVDTPLSPACTMDGDEELIEHALTAGASGYHTLGTCAMGPDDDDVVDSRLRVRGVDALRVVDASVFPYQPSGNTSAPAQALAWHAATLILEDI